MMTETAVAPLTVPEASRTQIEALGRVWMHQSAYARLRGRLDITATTRARADWGMAVLEFIEASVALAAAKDRRSPAWAAATGRARMFTVTSPERASCEQAWARYQEIRQTGNLTAVETARHVWRIEFVAWFEKVAARGAIEDEEAFRELSAQIDESRRFGAKPEDGDPQASRRAHLLHTARERERQELIRRARERAGSTAPLGWQPTN